MKKLLKRITWNSPVVLIYLAVCFVATLLGYLTNGGSTKLLFATYRSSLLDPMTYLRLFTHAAGHANWEHFFGNATFLLLLGPMLEDRYGKRKIIEVILLTAFASGVVNFLLFPHTMLSGASGVVFAWILLTSFTSFREGEIPITVILVATVFIGQEIYEGIMIRDNISNTAHIVGGMVGAMFGYHLNKKPRN